MSGQAEINTSLRDPETCQEARWTPGTGWPAGCKSSSKMSLITSGKNKMSTKTTPKTHSVYLFFEWQNVLSQINSAGVCQRREALFITLFSHSLFRQSLLCSHIFFSSAICCSLASLTTWDSRTRVWTVKNGENNKQPFKTFGIFQCWQ